jgi:Spy/CpxP family protein refolding chaperone
MDPRSSSVSVDGKRSARLLFPLLLLLLLLPACTQGEWQPRGGWGSGQGGSAPLDPEDPDTIPLPALGLTDEQRAQIRALQQAARPTLDALRQPDDAYRQSRLALLRATPFQPDTARQLALRDAERRLQLHVKRLELQHAIFHVLTPSQQAQLETWWKTRPAPSTPRRRR